MKAYRKLFENIAEQIRSGKLLLDGKVPSVRQLCVEHKLSLPTVYRALRELVAVGLITPQRGKGFFVTGTRPCEVERKLSTASGKIITFCNFDLVDMSRQSEYFSDLYSNIDQECEREGLNFSVIKFPSPKGQIDFILHTIKSDKQISGVIFTSLQTIGENKSLIEGLSDLRCPLVFLSEFSRAESYGISSIGVDFAGVGCMAAEYMIEKKVGKIAIVGRGYLMPSPHYIIALNAQGTWINCGRLSEDCIISLDSKDCMPWNGYRAVKDIMGQHPEIDGWIFTHHLLAEGGCEWLRESGFVPGERVQVITDSRVELVKTKLPHGVACFEFPAQLIASEAVGVMLSLLGGNQITKRIRITPPMVLV